MPVSRAFRADSSRTSRDAAGWLNKGKPGDASTAVERVRDAHFPRSFNWLRPRVLLESRNDFLAKLVEIADTDIVNDERMRWVASQRDHGLVDDDVVIDARALGKDGRSFSFLAVGDPGEADISQYVVVPHLLAQEDTSFMVIVSDVIYPTGESNDYADAFYRAYRSYERPIYALPGNHDWYSLLTGFMWNICGAEPLPEPTERLASYSWQERLARFLWLRPRTPERELLMAYRKERWEKRFPGSAACAPRQQTPYFAIDTGSLLLVCIDTGTSGTIDREQGEWLGRMAERSGPKILFTGKPLWVNGREDDCDIKWLPKFSEDDHPERTGDPRPRRTAEPPGRPDDPKTVNAIVSKTDHDFIAAVGGDIHNYQRYPVGETQYVVSGGGGAFMSPTHTIKSLDELDDVPVEEKDFRCYPLRGDSLARFALGSIKRLWLAVGALGFVALALWFAALQVWNPHNANMRHWGFVPLAWSTWFVKGANISPGTEVFGLSPLSWVPESDYGDWGAIVLGSLALAIGVALLVLPWFNWRVKVVLTLAAAGAALLAWHNAIFQLPGGMATYFVVGIVGALAIPVFSRPWARQLRLLLRAIFVAALLVAAVLTSDWERNVGWWVVVPETFVLTAVAFVLVGGPRLKMWPSILAGVVIFVLTAILFTVPLGGAAIPIAFAAGLVTLAFVLAAFFLLPVLRGGAVDADQAAQYLSAQDLPSRPNATTTEVDSRMERKLSALKRVYLGETIYSALFDNDNQPFFKNFLRIDVKGNDVTVYCFGVVEGREDEGREDEGREDTGPEATVEDHFRWHGTRWTEARAILGEGGTLPVRGEVDWFPGADVRFHLDADVGTWFTVLFWEGNDWRPSGTLEYLGRDSCGKLDDPGATRPGKIALRRAGDGPDEPLYAEGTFV